MLTLSLAWFATAALAADALTPHVYEPEIAMIVGGMLEEAHYDERTLDDSASELEKLFDTNGSKPTADRKETHGSLDAADVYL